VERADDANATALGNHAVGLLVDEPLLVVGREPGGLADDLARDHHDVVAGERGVLDDQCCEVVAGLDLADAVDGVELERHERTPKVVARSSASTASCRVVAGSRM
jgi:hypothetical protein